MITPFDEDINKFTGFLQQIHLPLCFLAAENPDISDKEHIFFLGSQLLG